MAEIRQLLTKMVTPNTAVVKEATQQLKLAVQNGDGVLQLCQVMGDTSVPKDMRMAASSVLSGEIKRNDDVWSNLNQQQKNEMKGGLLLVLGQEQECEYMCRLYGLLMAAIASKEEWPELLPCVTTHLASSNCKVQTMSAFALCQLSVEVPDRVQPHITRLAPVLLAAVKCQDLSSTAVAQLLTAASCMADVISPGQAKPFRDLMDASMAVAVHRLTKSQTEGGALDEDPVWGALELMDSLFRIEIPVLRTNVEQYVLFAINMASNNSLDDGHRNRAILLLNEFLRTKKKLMIKLNLHTRIIQCIVEPICVSPSEDVEEDDEEEDNPLLAASCEALEQAALNLPPVRLLSPLMPLVEAAFTSNNQHRIKGGFRALALIAEGCGECLRTKHLDTIVTLVLNGLQSEFAMVRNAASEALAEFSEHLQPDINKHHKTLLPLLIQQLRNAETSVSCHVFEALETFTETMEEKDLKPYLPDTMQLLVVIIASNRTSAIITGGAISVIGSLATTAEADMLPYFEGVVSVLRGYFTNTCDGSGEECKSDLVMLKLQALETLSRLVRALGPDHFTPFATDATDLCMQTLQVATATEDPDLRKTVYRLVSALAHSAPAHLTQHLPVLVASCEQALRSGNNGEDLTGPESEELDEDEEEELLVHNPYLEEKEDAVVTLGQLLKCCGAELSPQLQRIVELVVTVALPHASEEVRAAAVATVAHVATHMATHAAAACGETVAKLLPLLLERVAKDCYMVVTASLEGIQTLLEQAGGAVVVESFPAVLECVAAVLGRRVCCQGEEDSDEDDDEDDMDEAEKDEMLVEYAGDVIPPLAKAMGSVAFAAVFPEVVRLLAARCHRNSTAAVRSYVVGLLAECIEVLGRSVAPFTVELTKLLSDAAADTSEDDVRSNAYYAMGLLAENAGDAFAPAAAGVSEALGAAVQREEGRAKDNAAAALLRTFVSHGGATAGEVVTIALSALPLREDFAENETVARCLQTLLGRGQLPGREADVLRWCQLLVTTTEVDEENKEALEAIRSLAQAIQAANPGLTGQAL